MSVCQQEASEGASVCRPAVRAATVKVTAASVGQRHRGSCHRREVISAIKASGETISDLVVVVSRVLKVCT